MDEIEERSAHQFLEAPAQGAGEGGTQPDEIALGVGNAEHVQGQVEEAVDVRFCLPAGNQLVAQLATEQLHLGLSCGEGEESGMMARS
ncbi:MAG: hypothetical protein MRJ92_09385 [Nitrospira sp.]|nr:hypothetical protein [Nitrospira sp.]